MYSGDSWGMVKYLYHKELEVSKIEVMDGFVKRRARINL